MDQNHGELVVPRDLFIHELEFVLKTVSIFLSAFMPLMFVACTGDEPPADPIIVPSNLQVVVTNPNDGSGFVSVSATADNAFHFDIYFGDSENTPIRATGGVATYTYSESGSYTIEVRALGNGEEYKSYEERVSINVNNTGGFVPSTGATSPVSYAGMTLIWQDEFSGSELNENDWNYEIGTGANGWGNNELQYYRRDNTEVAQGYLFITAKQETFGGRNYTSSRLTTQNKFDFQYGRVDIRAALPKGQGIWPALWMLGADFNTVGWPGCGEIDIMEMIGGGDGRDDTVHGTCHWQGNDNNHALYGGSKTLSTGYLYDEFHVFSITWDNNSIEWYLDGNQYHNISTSPADLDEFRDDFFLIFNVAVGGNWPGSPNATTQFPQRMIVDYVRVFQDN